MEDISFLIQALILIALAYIAYILSAFYVLFNRASLVMKTKMDPLDSLFLMAKDVNLLAKCVKSGHHKHGDQVSLSTKDWNC